MTRAAMDGEKFIYCTPESNGYDLDTLLDVISVLLAKGDFLSEIRGIDGI